MYRMKHGFSQLIISASFALILFHQESEAIMCMTCTWTLLNPTANADCYHGNSSTTFVCPYGDSFNPYCETVFQISDGIVTGIDRACEAGANDNYYASQLMPEEEHCVSQFQEQSESVDSTTCYFSCNNSDNCNQIGPATLKLCANSCGPSGNCDYIKGICVCDDEFSGDACSNGVPPPSQTFMSCIQCDGEADSSIDCSTFGQSSPCPSPAQQYCAVSKTTTYSADGNRTREFVTRSCTSDFVAADECFISVPENVANSGDIEYTCVSTCDSNNCNAGIPNGFVSYDDPKEPLRCVVCNSDEDISCNTTSVTTACPSSATHCQSTLKYFISDKTDMPSSDPDYMFESIVRTCATSAVTRQCKTSSIDSSSLKKVTCQESCQSDGCNTGWPARPRCSQCSCQNCAIGNLCLDRPPLPTSCDQPYHAYCTVQDSNRNIGTTNSEKGFPRGMIRSCSYKSIPNNCVSSTFGNIVLETCDKSCSTDGCNLGFPPSDFVQSSANFISKPVSKSMLAIIGCVFMLFIL